jgi:hypothetical protein
MAEQAEIGQIETHGSALSLAAAGRHAFEFDEGKLRQIPIVRQVLRHHIRERRKDVTVAIDVGRPIAASCNIG